MQNDLDAVSGQLAVNYDRAGMPAQAIPYYQRAAEAAQITARLLRRYRTRCMPTHIYTRRGLWQDSIEWNKRSAAAAWEQNVDAGAVSMHYLHALDYLVYAYLQRAEDQKAKEILDRALSLKSPFHQCHQSQATRQRESHSYARSFGWPLEKRESLEPPSFSRPARITNALQHHI